MGKFEQKKKQPVGLLAAAAVLLVIVVAGIVLFVLPQVAEKEPKEETAASTSSRQTEPQSAETTAQESPLSTAPALEFPISLAEGKLTLESLFQFDGFNPDSDNAEGKNIASILLRNVSEEYLTEAHITVKLADGTELGFTVTELPAGKSVMAFSVENQSIAADAVCIDAACEPAFNSEADAADKVTAEVNGLQITLTNNTDATLEEIVVYCRCPFGEDYFGGIAYRYTVNDLPAGESTTVDAVDCILGMAEVVRIAVNEFE